MDDVPEEKPAQGDWRITSIFTVGHVSILLAINQDYRSRDVGSKNRAYRIWMLCNTIDRFDKPFDDVILRGGGVLLQWKGIGGGS